MGELGGLPSEFALGDGVEVARSGEVSGIRRLDCAESDVGRCVTWHTRASAKFKRCKSKTKRKAIPRTDLKVGHYKSGSSEAHPKRARCIVPL